jgi:hypothetical protein
MMTEGIPSYNMVANHNRLVSLVMLTCTTSLSIIPIWPFDDNEPKAKSVYDFNHLIKGPFMDAFHGAGGSQEYLDMSLILARRNFLLNPANTVTRAEIEILNGKHCFKAASTAV